MSIKVGTHESVWMVVFCLFVERPVILVTDVFKSWEDQ